MAKINSLVNMITEAITKTDYSFQIITEAMAKMCSFLLMITLTMAQTDSLIQRTPETQTRPLLPASHEGTPLSVAFLFDQTDQRYFYLPKGI